MKHLFISCCLFPFRGLSPDRPLYAAVLLCACLISFNSMAQQNIDLAKLQAAGQLHLFNRSIVSAEPKTGVVQLDEKSGEGIAWLDNQTFKTGKIEVDLKGKDFLQKSFLGIAFHGSNDTTYEAIYFRPFNFLAKDSVRNIHAVQYISHPEYPWKKLRDEHNGIYEKSVQPKPDPNNWFHATIEVTNEEVLVFVNHAKNASLHVKRLSHSETGKIGLWVGDGSGGEFLNLTLQVK